MDSSTLTAAIEIERLSRYSQRNPTLFLSEFVKFPPETTVSFHKQKHMKSKEMLQHSTGHSQKS
jgi:hypothetical protein